MSSKIKTAVRPEAQVKKEFKDGDVLYLDAITALEDIGYASKSAEAIVEQWFEEVQNGNLS